jgi:hypothetical protein
MKYLEPLDDSYPLNPDCKLMDEWNIYGYDESLQNYKALEGELLFLSCATIKVENEYRFNLSVVPYFLTCMRKFKNSVSNDICFTENIGEERNRIIVTSKIESILKSVEPHSIILIDGPLIGENASYFMVTRDDELRKKECIPLYFVKNSDSKLVVQGIEEISPQISQEFNSDFHWAACQLPTGSRSAFFKYTEDKPSTRNSKVFSYVKPIYGFPERVEMHTLTYEKYHSLMPQIMDLLAYFYVVQGDRFNPQVRPIAIAEKYAREGLKILNIPALLARLGFRPTINQVRFG